MWRKASKSRKRGIRTDNWFSMPYPNPCDIREEDREKFEQSTHWSIGPIDLNRIITPSHYLDVDREILVPEKRKWRLIIERKYKP